MFYNYFFRLDCLIDAVSECPAIVIKQRKVNFQVRLLWAIQTTEVNVIGVNFGCLFNHVHAGALGRGLFQNPL